jgi:hypothetical protein
MKSKNRRGVPKSRRVWPLASDLAEYSPASQRWAPIFWPVKCQIIDHHKIEKNAHISGRMRNSADAVDVMALESQFFPLKNQNIQIYLTSITNFLANLCFSQTLLQLLYGFFLLSESEEFKNKLLNLCQYL